MIRARQSRALSPSSPFNWRSAWRRCRSVSAWMRSSRPSASVRSSLPFSKARRVNSPGSAGAHIFESRQRREQCRQHRASAMDVKFGDVFAGRAGRARETRAPPHRRSAAGRHRAAARGSPFAAAGSCRPAPSATVPACGPETRTMAIALGGRPDDSAKMVWSRGCIAYLCRSLEKATQFRFGGLERCRRSAASIAAVAATIAARSAKAPSPRPDRNKYYKFKYLHD